MFTYVSQRWSADGGYREFLGIALPLILSTASWSIQLFVDRVFLTWNSTHDLAAAMPAGMTNFMFVSFFIGIAQYTNTFVAQYVGAGRPERVGPAVWQGLYLSVFALLAGFVCAALAKPIFDLVGHDPIIRRREIDYFRVLCYGMGPFVLSTAAACFFTGRGNTWTVLVVNAAATVLNIVLDYGLIFGAWGMPRLGIEGAGWATNLSTVFAAGVFFALFLQAQYRDQYATLRGWHPDFGLIIRLLRYGGPNGLTFMLDILVFSLFILLVGRLGIVHLAATNLAFNINSLAFMPLIGGGIAVTTMVGQRLGANQPAEAEYATWTGLHLAVFYMGTMAVAYLLVPALFLTPYGFKSHGAEFGAAHDMAISLLRIVGIYCVFDALYIIFTAALKGAGDTRYIMIVSMSLGWMIMIIPSVLWLRYMDQNIFVLFGFVCLYIIILGILFFLRFRQGKWKKMRVIEVVPCPPSEAAPRFHEAKAGA